MSYYKQLPRHVRSQKKLWMSRVYVIHFWMVEYQHADRVMRQFGKYQEIPPPPPLPYESDINYLRHEWVHTGSGQIDICWRQTHIAYIEAAKVFIEEQRPYDPSSRSQYAHWFFNRGMPTVYLRDRDPAVLQRQPPPRTVDVETLSYVPRSHRDARVVRILFCT